MNRCESEITVRGIFRISVLVAVNLFTGIRVNCLGSEIDRDIIKHRSPRHRVCLDTGTVYRNRLDG